LILKRRVEYKASERPSYKWNSDNEHGIVSGKGNFSHGKRRSHNATADLSVSGYAKDSIPYWTACDCRTSDFLLTVLGLVWRWDVSSAISKASDTSNNNTIYSSN